jgi:RNA polymerase sigma factor (sigma-70 family)
MAARTAHPISLDNMTAFYEAIDRMPMELRAVFRSRFVHGLSQAETAEQLGVSVDMVKHRFREAKRRLKNALGGAENES